MVRIRASRVDMFFPFASLCLFLSSTFYSFSYVPIAADGELHLQAAETVVRQVREAKGGSLLRRMLPGHQGVRAR